MIGLGLVGLRRLLRRVGHPRPCCGVSGALYAGRVLHPRNLPSAPAGVGHDPAVVRTGGPDWAGGWTGTTGSAALLCRSGVRLSVPPGTGDDLAVGSVAVGGVLGTAGELASVMGTTTRSRSIRCRSQRSSRKFQKTPVAPFRLDSGSARNIQSNTHASHTTMHLTTEPVFSSDFKPKKP